MADPTENTGLEAEDNTSSPLEDDQEVEIELIDDTPEKDRGRKPLEKPVEEPTDEELGAYSEGVRKRINDLTHARHDERRAKEQTLREKQELDRIARALADENRQLREQYNAGAIQYAATAGNAAEMRLNNARAKLKEAHEAFDTDAIVAAQEELSDAKNAWNAAKSFRPPPVQPQQQVVQPQPEAEVAAPIDDKTLRWQARNQWWGAPQHKAMTLFSLGVHNELADEGIVVGSDDYFARIDERMHQTFPDFFGAKPKPKPNAQRTATVVASGTRTTATRKIQLTPTALALAKRLNLTPQQYAAAVAKQQQDES